MHVRRGNGEAKLEAIGKAGYAPGRDIALAIDATRSSEGKVFRSSSRSKRPAELRNQRSLSGNHGKAQRHRRPRHGHALHGAA